ncbi:MAG: response regulator transcription factor [Anaerolineales bacterium]|nr:response regulator transcription factor [Anaerolineales bacterium]
MSDYKILLVEDNQKMTAMVQLYLEQEGFKLLTAAAGPEGEALFMEETPQLAILDIMLPGFDGLELCRRIRQRSTAPILLLTARATDVDKAIGLGVGADDYLTKPFSPTELIARVKALLRRAYQYSDSPQSSTHLLGGPRLQLDPSRHTVTFDGASLDVTPLEFKLLEMLMKNEGWAFTRVHLLETVWGYEEGLGEETVTVHVSNLRQKLGEEGAQLIRTVRGVGYAYEERK